MWWRKTGKDLPLPVGLNMGEIVYFRLSQFMVSQAFDGPAPEADGHRQPASRPWIPEYPGKHSLWRSQLSA